MDMQGMREEELNSTLYEMLSSVNEATVRLERTLELVHKLSKGGADSYATRWLMDVDEKKVLHYLTKHDPMGLMANGAPWDEYAPEAHTISRRLPEVSTQEEVLLLVREEFKHWFYPADIGPRENYTALAEELCKELGCGSIGGASGSDPEG